MGRVKVTQTAEAGHLGAPLSCKPQQNINIVAAFLKDHRAHFAAAPVAAHKAVSLVPVAHIFDLTKGGDLPDLVLVDQPLDGAVKGGVAKHMADTQYPARLLRCPGDGAALGLLVAHGLFQQDMITLPQCRQRRGGVHIVQRADQRCIRHLRAGEQLFPTGKSQFGRNAIGAAEQLPPVLFGLRHSQDAQSIRVLRCIFRVDLSPRARADHNRAHLFHFFASSRASRRSNSS